MIEAEEAAARGEAASPFERLMSEPRIPLREPSESRIPLPQPAAAPCLNCGGPMPPATGRRGRPRKHCTPACKHQHMLKLAKARGPEGKRPKSERARQAERARSRAQRKRTGGYSSAQRAKGFNRLTVLERDGWTCQLCGRRLQDKRPSDKDFAIVRRRDPQAIYSNDGCFAACLECNGRASAMRRKVHPARRQWRSLDAVVGERSGGTPVE
jgi:5-methylcytosine-specific restriction endonuclease McrA